MPILLDELVEAALLQIKTASELPSDATYYFDRDSDPDQAAADGGAAQKRLRRVVVSLRFGAFEAKQVVRQERPGNPTVLHHSPQLQMLVPKGQRYDYELIAHVGEQTFLQGRKLQHVHQELSHRRPALDIPFSSLYDMQRKFLFYFGQLHQQAAPALKDYLQQRGEVTWVIDGTLEPGTPVFFGVKEAQEGILLNSWKIATENADEIAQCLTETSQGYGRPHEVLHDLSDAMDRACDTALDGVAHWVCEHHLLKDVGDDLYAAPQAALSKLVRSLKFQARLKEQRKGQTKWLREHLRHSKAPFVLQELLTGPRSQEGDTELLGREILLAFHFWIMDYASDGDRQGFPFDPYLLYFHRRVVQAHRALQEAFQDEVLLDHTPRVVLNFYGMLTDYVTHAGAAAAAGHYEKASLLFERLRRALRLGAQGESPMRHAHQLLGGQAQEVREALMDLRQECRENRRDDSDPEQRELCDIVATHLDRYEARLFVLNGADASRRGRERTTAKLEGHWDHSKAMLRRSHGRKKLPLEFQALPQEYMLVFNLEIPRYEELVWGDRSRLPEKLADAGKHAGPFTQWLAKRKPLNLGRLPKRILRQENFVESLIGVYEDHAPSFL